MKIGIYYDIIDRGPGKVASNLVKGLSNLGVSYSINSEGDKNIILQSTARLHGDLSNCIIGPNICTLPIDNHITMNYDSYSKIIVPSLWVKNLYSKWIPENKIEVWPVGIDTETFDDFSNYNKEVDFLIYHKRRSSEELHYIINFLNKINKTYITVSYGNYSEDTFLSIIKKSKRAIILDGTESQGIAIQEIMSCNIPLLVWDVQEWNDRGKENSCYATSIPYFDKTCGVIFYDKDELETAYSIFNMQDYNPRKYIVDNLGLDSQAKKLISLFK